MEILIHLNTIFFIKHFKLKFGLLKLYSITFNFFKLKF